MSTLGRIGIVFLSLLGLVATGCSSEVRIGAVISESGAVSTYGERVRKGIELAQEEINGAGGVKGKVIELVFRDDATNPERGRQVTEELIKTEKTRVVIGAISSAVTLAIAPICEQNRVILFSPSASAPAITDAGQYVYRNFPSDILEGTSMAKFAKDLGLERVVVFALDNEFGKGLSHVFTQQYEGRFRHVVQSFSFDENDASAFPRMVREAKKLDPQGLYIVSYAMPMVELLKEIRKQKLDAVLMGSASTTDDVLKMAGPAAENLVYPQPAFDLDSTEPGVAPFVKAYRTKYGEDPDIYAAHGYDALKILAQAIELQGSAHPEDVRLGLARIKDHAGAAGRTSFDERGDVVRYPRIQIVREGQVIPYADFVEQGGSLLGGS